MSEIQPSFMEEVCDQLSCLLHQEENYHKCTVCGDKKCTPQNNKETVEDCVEEFSNMTLRKQQQQVSACDGTKKHESTQSQRESPRAVSAISCTSNNEPANPLVLSRGEIGFWRQQLFDWSNLVVNSYRIDREVVSVAFNILDRYMSNIAIGNRRISREDFQLYCMTSLYIAIKTVESVLRRLSVETFVDMSCGFYNADDIKRTERDILQKIGWLVHPPTINAFCGIYWSILHSANSGGIKEQNMKSTSAALMDLATCDMFFVSRKSSIVGLAATLIAAKVAGFSDADIDCFILLISESLRGHHTQEEFNECYKRLDGQKNSILSKKKKKTVAAVR